MKILLTGHKGNLGTSLRERGPLIEWCGIGRENWQDLRKNLQGVTTVLHTASDVLVSPRDFPLDFIRNNIALTAELLEAMRDNNVKKLFFTSSCAVYGDSQITKEIAHPTPLTLNGISKYLNEKMIEEFCVKNGIEFVIFRLFNIFGGKDRFSIVSRLQNACQKNLPFTLFNEGLSQRDFVHVNDAADLILRVIELGKTSPKVLNIGSGQPVKIAELAKTVQNRFPKLKIEFAHREEAEYSRAQTDLLRQTIGNFSTISVLDFLKDWSASSH
jgi:UDP-glucose 4-epimerase